MNDLREHLASTLDEIRRLEAQLANEPDLATAVQLAGHKEVAHRLVAKVEQEEAAERAVDYERQTAEMRQRYDEAARELDALYAKAADALRLAIDTIETAYDRKVEVRRLWNILEKRDARPGQLPNSFWPRHPDLKEAFMNSVLRNGEA